MTLPIWFKGVLLVTLTFAAGVLCGVAYERRLIPAHQAAGRTAHDALHQWTRELDLDAAQQQAISEILARHQGEIDSSWHELQPHVRATVDATTRDILAVLRPDQIPKYRKMMDAMHSAAPH